MLYNIIYAGEAVGVIVKTYEEAEEYMIGKYGRYNHDELMLEEVTKEQEAQGFDLWKIDLRTLLCVTVHHSSTYSKAQDMQHMLNAITGEQYFIDLSLCA